MTSSSLEKLKPIIHGGGRAGLTPANAEKADTEVGPPMCTVTGGPGAVPAAAKKTDGEADRLSAGNDGEPT